MKYRVIEYLNLLNISYVYRGEERFLQENHLGDFE